MRFWENITRCYLTDNSDADRFFRMRQKIGGGYLTSLWARYKCKSICKKANAFIPTSAKIGENCIFPHGLNGILISHGAEIGDNCIIFHQVTIGSNTLKDSRNKGFPKIGNNVFIGCGAKIIGNVCVGNNVRIGANAVVTKDIPANSTVVLSEPRIIVRERRDNTL